MEVEVSNLDHLGIISGMVDRLSLVKVVDSLIPSEKKVSHGLMVKALVKNAMGFSQQALYLTPEFMGRISLNHLLGEGLLASDFNDDSVGRSLDALYAYGLSNLFVQLSHKACKEMGVDSDFIHVDSTNFSLEGAYAGADGSDSVKICHGFAKSKRFDLKQVTLGLLTTYQSSIPRYMQSFDGNASDKESLSSMIKAYISCFEAGENGGIFICDSGVYSAENIKEELKMADWITRVPETIKEVQVLRKNTKDADFKDVMGIAGYRFYATKSEYGGVSQRWLVIRFILATNVLDTNTLSNEKMIEAYKSQATSVENGFKFLKDPIFFAESFFVKKPERLEALLMIMAVSLLVYSLAERELQTQLKKHNETIINQDKRVAKKPTMRLVFNLFRGIHLVYMPEKQETFCTNLNENHKKIIGFMGKEVAKYYFLAK